MPQRRAENFSNATEISRKGRVGWVFWEFFRGAPKWSCKLFAFVEYLTKAKSLQDQGEDRRETLREVATVVSGSNPRWTIHPDWAIVMEHEHRVYLVRETKGTDSIEALAPDERDKVKCGAKHFGSLGVNFKVVSTAADLKV